MDKTLETALKYAERGFAVHWLRPKSKAPLSADWSTAPVMTPAELRDSYRPEYNVGFRPGKWSVVDGKEICVLDVDIRGGEPFAAEAYAAAQQITECTHFDVISGSGVGRHTYLGFPVGTSPDKAATTLRQSDVWVDQATGDVVPHGTDGAKPAWLIEVLSTGKNVVMPPSIHPDTLKPYEWSQS